MVIVGIDEVGRGCWAGPLVAGAVILRAPIPGLKDSKKLSKIRRETLARQIHEEAVAVGLGWVWPEALDTYGISISVKKAMEMALKMVEEQIRIPYDEVIVDGNINYLPEVPSARAVIKADDTVPAASAASIIAKVARDEYMSTVVAKKHPAYGFEKHVGYGTAVHVAALEQFGVIDGVHRMSYKPIKRLYNNS